MPYGLYLSADGAHAAATRLEVIANNLANVDTVGFKRELALFRARYAEEIESGQAAPGTGEIEDVGGGVMVEETVTDFSPGPLKRTEIPTDMAIEGDGFFMVRKDGEDFLTRAGDFRLNAQGELLTQQGFPVLNDALEPIVIDPSGGPWQVSPAGEIRQRGATYSLAIVQPTSLGDLVRSGENLFEPLADPMPLPHSQRRVAGGYLEMSGVQPTMEMIGMIEASRVIEANLNMMQTQDEMLSGLINRLMRTS